MYAEYMKFTVQVKAEEAGKPKTKESLKVAYLYAGILIILVLAQLFTFDKFAPLVESFNFPGGELTGRLAASMLVICEVLALPFLLRLKLSPLMRAVSMILIWVVPVFWLKASLWLVLTDSRVSNIGFLGTLVKLTPGWWAVFVSLALGFLAAWASWGLWPIPRSKKH